MFTGLFCASSKSGRVVHRGSKSVDLSHGGKLFWLCRDLRQLLQYLLLRKILAELHLSFAIKPGTEALFRPLGEVVARCPLLELCHFRVVITEEKSKYLR